MKYEPPTYPVFNVIELMQEANNLILNKNKFIELELEDCGGIEAIEKFTTIEGPSFEDCINKAARLPDGYTPTAGGAIFKYKGLIPDLYIFVYVKYRDNIDKDAKFLQLTEEIFR